MTDMLPLQEDPGQRQTATTMVRAKEVPTIQEHRQ